MNPLKLGYGLAGWTVKVVGGAFLLMLGGTLYVSHAALIAYWPFNEGTGTVAHDVAGRLTPHDGTLAVQGSGALPQWIPGRFGYALDFNRVDDGNGSRVVVPFQNDLWLNDAFTISFWYRPGPNIGSFPGPMRIGSQSATTGSNIGWGFFRARSGNRLTYKRGNAQPNMFPPSLVNGTWYHVVLRHDGGSRNTAIIFGLSTNETTQTWLDATATTVFEFGRMDQMDDCDLDDVAFFDEALPLERIYSLNSVPSKLGVDYSLKEVMDLWQIFDGGPGNSGTVKDRVWTYTTNIAPQAVVGDAYVSGTQWYVVLAPGAGLTAPATFYGDISPAGAGRPGMLVFESTPDIHPSARLVFDLGADNEVGPHNDHLFIDGDLNVASNTVVIHPLAPLTNGTYWLIKYSGKMMGELNPSVMHQSRYQMTLDTTEPGKVMLVVTGANASLQWVSASSANWDFTTGNWRDLRTSEREVFQQADDVLFDDTEAVVSNVVLSTVLFPSRVTVASTHYHFSFTGPGALGGMTLGGLIKSGPSTLTLGNANLFLGPVNIQEGMVKLGHPSALGAAEGETVIASGATLDLAGFSPGTEPIRMVGNGMGGQGAIINSGTALVNNGVRGVVTLEGDVTVGGSNRFDFFAGKIVGNGHRLLKVGPSEIALAHLGQTDLGGVDVQAGQLTILGDTQLGDAAHPIIVHRGATLAFWATAPHVCSKPISLRNGRLLNNTAPASDTATLGFVDFRETNIVEGVSSFTIQGEISGYGQIQKNGQGALTLMGESTFAGVLHVHGGRLVLGEACLLGGVSNLFLGPGTVLDVSSLRSDAKYEVPWGQTLAGSGQVHGNLAVNRGATLSPGGSAGTLTVTNDLWLDENATLVFELGSSVVEGGGTNDLLEVFGRLGIGGRAILRIVPMAELNTTDFYTLIHCPGGETIPTENFEVVSDSRYTFLLDNSVPGKLRLLATAAGAILTWQGDHPSGPGLWDLNQTPNWQGDERFLAGDTVVFDDQGRVSRVELVGDLYPALWRVEANEVDYVFGGAGRIRGGALTKSLNGRMQIANTGVNDFSGPITLLGGTLLVGDGGTAGNLGPGPVENRATLVLNRSDDLTWANAMTGDGNFIKANTNTLTLGASMAAFDGTITAQQGRLRPTASTAFGTAAGPTILEPGAAMEINGLNFGAEVFTVGGAGPDGLGVLVNSGAGQNNAFRFVHLSADATFNALNRFDVRANPDAAFGGNGYALTKLGPAQFSLVSVGNADLGDIHVLQGILSVEGNTYLGSRGVLLVTNGATVMFWGSTEPQDKPFVLASGARLFKDNGAATLRGPGWLSGSNVVEAASNAGTDLTLAGIIGGDGALTKLGAGNLFLTADNSYTGGTVVGAGNLFLGNGGGSGSVAGDIDVNGTLWFWRNHEFRLTNNIQGPGNVHLRTPGEGALHVDGSARVEIGGNFEVGRDIYGKLILRPGARLSVGRLNLGNIAGTVGEVIQGGGDVFVALEMRVGHWPNNTSHYQLFDGTLNITNVPVGVVNPNTVAEQNGILYLGIDGTGIFTQTGGEAIAHGIVLDGRGETAGTDTFNLEGGVFRIGPSGFKSGNLDNNTSYQINLGGGTVAAWQSWTSVLNMTLTGTNGLATFDTGPHTIELDGVLSGPGGLDKRGAGLLILRHDNNNYTGETLVREGTLRVEGDLAGTVVVRSDGTLEPGSNVRKIRIQGNLVLEGILVMDLLREETLLKWDMILGVATQYCGGVLRVTASGDPLQEGDTFQLFESEVFVGAFDALELPPLREGLAWDTSRLTVDGSIKVVTAPPPSPSFVMPERHGNELILRGSGGPPGLPYALMASDRLDLPVSEWKEVGRGQFELDGSFSQTILLMAEPGQQYFMLIYPPLEPLR